MSAREELNSYIGRIERRLRLAAASRGVLILASAALAATLLLVLVANGFAFSAWSVIGARFILLGALLFAAGVGLALPLRRLGRRQAAAKAEAAFPPFQQRLVTYVERDAAASEPFLDLLAADTVKLARSFNPESLVSGRALLVSLGAALAAAGVLIWLIAAGPGYVGYGASLLWMGSRAGAAPLYEIRVSPGNASVRRNSDELVTAQPIGFETSRVRLLARYDSATKWNELSMKPQPGGSGFQFVFAGLPEGVEYYAEAGAVRSRHFHIGVVDLPAVKQIQVTYRYPSWTGMKDAVVKRGGDLRAIQGTTADLAIQMDRPLGGGVLLLEDGRRISLSGGRNDLYRASIAMTKDGAYHVAAIVQGRPVRLSEDYFIEANKPNPPEVQVVRPAGDYRASPIEEVTVAVKAAGDFGLKGFGLHYSVNGGPEHTVDLLKRPGAKQASGRAVLSLEKFKLVPGDVVSYYASAKDARIESHTGINFIQAVPYEIDYSQSQQSGGGGGGGMNGQNEISRREKEIIASTWERQNAEKPLPRQAAEAGKFLSEVQSKLRKQAIALAGRMQLRDLNQQNQEFSSFQKDMAAAAQVMGPAADQLHQQHWKDALPSEQKALRYLLQAEATFRRIQVAFGGGAGAGNAGRDLAGLFDLELDTQKNQYETAQTASSDQRARNIDDALRKLDELARRQQDLAGRQRAGNGQSFEQRWQEEMLHRDAQRLQQQLEDMARSGQQGAASSGQTAQGRPANGASAPGGGNRDIQRALDALGQASDALGRAASRQHSAADARRAADRLRQATAALSAVQDKQASGRIDSLARQADRLASQQQAQANLIRRLVQHSQSADSQQPRSQLNAQSLARDRQRLADGLARIEQQVRDAASNLAPTQPPAASKLRDALGDLDRADLQMRLQRSADWLRQGFAPEPASELQIHSDLRRLSSNLRQAQSALGPAQPENSQAAIALGRAEQLRSQMQALARALGARSQGGQPGGRQSGPVGEGLDTPAVGGYTGGRQRSGAYPNGNIDTGNNSNLPQPVAPDHSRLPADPEAMFQQSVSTLNQLRRAVRQDPEIAREVRQLIRRMQSLDPRRFPGNPAVFKRMQSQALAAVENIELELRGKLDSQKSGQVRASETPPIPPGYRDAVAEYFRRLSKNH
ncbi:MAG TPA: hypothetical protein VNJ52_12480 [Patescibacteria group bacterium]|nr:hypothetical protein [Patescibacteria group bacterium]